MPKQTFFNLPEEKQKRIIDLAMDEFASHPYSKASLSRVVTRAGIAKGSMYQYFEDKKDLYIYLFDLAAREKMVYIQNHKGEENDNFYTALERILLAGTQFNLEHPKLSRIISNIMEPSGELVLQEIFERSKHMSYQYIHEMLSQAQENGSVRKDIDVSLAAYMLYSILGTGLLEYLLDVLNVSKHELLSDPEVSKRLNPEQIRSIISNTVNFIRNGLEGKSHD